MKVLVATLKEELATAQRLEEKYLKKIGELSPGSLVVRKLRRQKYAYLNRRADGKMAQTYLGKATDELIEHYRKTRALKLEYQKKLKSVREQIAILERALRGKTA